MSSTVKRLSIFALALLVCGCHSLPLPRVPWHHGISEFGFWKAAGYFIASVAVWFFVIVGTLCAVVGLCVLAFAERSEDKRGGFAATLVGGGVIALCVWGASCMPRYGIRPGGQGPSPPPLTEDTERARVGEWQGRLSQLESRRSDLARYALILKGSAAGPNESLTGYLRALTELTAAQQKRYDDLLQAVRPRVRDLSYYLAADTPPEVLRSTKAERDKLWQELERHREAVGAALADAPDVRAAYGRHNEWLGKLDVLRQKHKRLDDFLRAKEKDPNAPRPLIETTRRERDAVGTLIAVLQPRLAALRLYLDAPAAVLQATGEERDKLLKEVAQYQDELDRFGRK